LQRFRKIQREFKGRGPVLSTILASTYDDHANADKAAKYDVEQVHRLRVRIEQPQAFVEGEADCRWDKYQGCPGYD
jgi:hypothetical protein